MAQFQYIATDESGARQSGVLEAASRDEALAKLEQEWGWSVVELNETAEAKSKSHLSRRESEELASQLADLTASQLPLEQGLRKFADEMAAFSFLGGTGQRKRLYRLAAQLESGTTLEEAMRQQGAPADLIAAMRAGVRTGDTGQAMMQYVAYVKNLSSLRGRITLTFLYPAFLIIFALALFVLLLWVCIPIVREFEDMFTGFGMELPAVTTALFQIVNLVVYLAPGVGIACAILLLAAIVGALVLPSTVTRKIQLAVPVFGGILRSISMARFSHALGFLTSNRVPMSEALTIAGQSADDPRVNEAAQEWAERLEAGASLRDAARQIRGIPAELFESLHWNTNHETLSEALHAIGDMYEGRARIQSATVIAFAEPLVVVTVGFIFCWVVIGLFYPLTMLLNWLA